MPPIDRYRILSLLLRTTREGWSPQSNPSHQTSQDAVGHRARLSQPSLSRLEHLHDVYRNREVPPQGRMRANLLSCWIVGLQQSNRASADAIAWLFDGNVLSRDEINYFSGHLNETGSDRRNPYEETLRLLSKALGEYKGQPSPMVEVSFAEHDLERSVDERLLAMEQMPGQRLLVTAHLSSLVVPDSVIETDCFIDPINECTVEERLVLSPV